MQALLKESPNYESQGGHGACVPPGIRTGNQKEAKRNLPARELASVRLLVVRPAIDGANFLPATMRINLGTFSLHTDGSNLCQFEPSAGTVYCQLEVLCLALSKAIKVKLNMYIPFSLKIQLKMKPH